jgi:hypothetical protein
VARGSGAPYLLAVATHRDPEDVGSDAPEPTVRPTDRPARTLEEEDGDRLVPSTNVGGATPTPLGLDSGGNLPGPEDDLANLAEPEPPEPPEVGAVQVREDEGPRPDRSRR